MTSGIGPNIHENGRATQDISKKWGKKEKEKKKKKKKNRNKGDIQTD